MSANQDKKNKNHLRVSIGLSLDILVLIAFLVLITLIGMGFSYFGHQPIGLWLGMITICLAIPLALFARLIEIKISSLISSLIKENQVATLDLSNLPIRIWFFFLVVFIIFSLLTFIIGLTT